MTDSPEAAGKTAPKPITLDAVAGHLRRRAAHADDEALMLAITVRDLNAALQQAQAEIETLLARVAELEKRDGE